ncbi:MAG: SDR family NAD(P)-dependent oxidoreductase, partial [Actinomycetota bacterium]
MKRSVTPAVSPDLNGRVAVVGGAGAPGQGVGNGRAAALLLAAAGANVVAVDRVEADGATTASMIEADGGQAMAIIGDVTNADFCNHVLAATIERFGPPTVLVNNVGIGAAGSIVDTEPEIWDRVLRVNVNSVYQMSRTIVPAMAEAGGGAIVNTGSISSLRPTGNTAYATSK